MAEDIMPPERPIVTRDEAKALGLKRYYTGIPCKRGHVDERLVSGNDCIVCHRAAGARYSCDNREKGRERGAKYRADNPETVKQSKAAWDKANPEAVKKKKLKWAKENPEKAKNAQSKYVFENKQKCLEASVRWKRNNPLRAQIGWAAYYALHADRLREAAAIWGRNNPEAVRIRGALRRARQLGAGGNYKASDVTHLLKAQKHKCAYCKRSIRAGYHVDHIMPLALGGSNWPSNLQITCAKCNLSKGAKHPIAFAKSRGMLL